MKKLLMWLFIVGYMSLSAQTNISFFTKPPFVLNQQRTLFTSFENNNGYTSIGGKSGNGKYPIEMSKYSITGLFQRLLVFDSLDKYPNISYEFGNNPIVINQNIYLPTSIQYGGFYHFTPCMVRIDTAGNKQVWDYTFNNPTQLLYFDQLQNHYIYAQGETNRDTANPNYAVTTGVIMQLDTSGAELWRYNYTPSGTYRNAPAGIRATPDSGCVALFYIGPWSAYSTARLMKLNKNGQLQWQKNLPIPQGITDLRLIDYNNEDSSVLALNTPDDYSTEKEYLLYKIDKNAQLEWALNRNGHLDSFKIWNGHDTVYHYEYTTIAYNWIRGSRKNGYIGAGYDKRDSIGKWSANVENGYVLFINDSGQREWEATYYSADHGMQTFGFTSINTTSDGGYILTGNGTDSAGHQIGILVKIDSMGCLTADSCETRLISSITYYSPEQLRFSLYPNPATSTLHLAIEDNKKYEVAFYNLMGQKIHSQQIANNAEIDVRDWQQGIYFYQLLENGKPVGSGKVMKE